MTITASAQAPGAVLSHQKISETEGNFVGALGVSGDDFAISAVSLGDLNGDGVGDIAVGAPRDDDNGSNRGAVWILFLKADGTVCSQQKISDLEGGFSSLAGELEDGDQLGMGLACLGDLDGDGVSDLAVGAWHDRGGGPTFDQRGAVWILFLRSNGTVRAKQKINDVDGGFTGGLDPGDFFGVSLASLGDLDGDGVVDLAVGARQDDDGGTSANANRGAVWILFLNSNGTVKGHQKISDITGDFLGSIGDGDLLGSALACLGDLDGDGIVDLAAGANGDTPLGGLGSIWILFLNANGTVRGHQSIHSNSGGGMAGLVLGSLAFAGDLDGDGIGDLASGNTIDGDGGVNRGSVWILFLNVDGTARSFQKISDTQGGFAGMLEDEDWFGVSVASLADHDGDGRRDLAVGALRDDDGGVDHGAVWVLFLDGAFHATATPRNGLGGNALCLTNLSPPALGTSWDTEVEHGQHPGATLTILYGFALPSMGATIGAGELLVDVSSLRLFRHIVAAAGSSDLHSIAVPCDVTLAGLTATSQALVLGGAGPELCNAVDLVLGL